MPAQKRARMLNFKNQGGIYHGNDYQHKPIRFKHLESIKP